MNNSPKDLYIIAAGKSSRMKSAFPKALIEIADDEPNITRTIRLVGDLFQNIFVVTNENDKKVWDCYFQALNNPKVVNLSIKSGLGDGHAIMTALKLTKDSDTYSNDIVIMWGDAVLVDGLVVKKTLDYKLDTRNFSGIIPAVYEPNPYVCLETVCRDGELVCTHALFSKHGEIRSEGYHDQSIFRFERTMLLSSLIGLHAALWKRDKYITASGELSMLYTFHHLYNLADYPLIVLGVNADHVISFNTPEEFSAIQRQLSGAK